MNQTSVSGIEHYTMKVLCDDHKTVYVDGTEMTLSSGAQGWDSIATFDIPATTSVIGIKCQDAGGGHGIKVEVADETGKVVLTSDVTWKCSKEEQSTNGWAENSFQENQTWGPAVVTINHYQGEPWATGFSGEVIWTSAIVTPEIVYCRIQFKGILFMKHIICSRADVARKSSYFAGGENSN